MGANLSNNKPLDAFSKEEIADIVASYGSRYDSYKTVIKENGMDGGYLASLNEEEFLETLDDLEVSARLHRRKFLKEFQKCQGEGGGGSGSVSDSSRRGSDSSVATTTRTSFVSSTSSEAEEEALQMLSAIQAENTKLRRSLIVLNTNNRRRASLEKMKAPPEGQAAIVMTDIQGSTGLWEAAPFLMRKALNQHDQIIRKHIASNAGYEVTTEGDAFVVAFHDGSDAINFALETQEAMNGACWDGELLELPWTRDDGNGRRGPRVRISIHMGNVKTLKDPCSERVSYAGEAVHIAKSLEGLAAGGQIITSSETWSKANRDLISGATPTKVASLGTHAIAPKRHCASSEPIELDVIEVAPASLNLMGALRLQQ